MVIDATSRQPLEGVHLRLYAIVGPGTTADAYGAESGAGGWFSFSSVPPRAYALQARRNGFVYLPGDRRVTLKAGDAVSDLTVEITQAAVITGRVVDNDGDPVENAIVRAVPVGGNSPISVVIDRMFSSTDDRGEFRISGAPGKFYITATKQRWQNAVREIRSDGSEIPVYRETWYPSADSQAAGTVVSAVAGKELSGIDIRLLRNHRLAISGVVTGIPAGSDHVQVSAHTEYRMVPATPDAEGKFSFAGLPPDHYRLTARYEAGGLLLSSREVEVSLEGADENDVNLALAGPEEISGNVEIEGASPDSGTMQSLTVSLHPVSPSYYVPAMEARPERNAHFSISPVYPGRFRVQAAPLPENAFVKSVRLNGTAAAETVIDLSNGVAGSEIKVTIGLNGGQIEGTVSSTTGKSACCAMVVFAASAESVNDNMKAVPAGEKYRFTGLRPGKYRFIVADPAKPYGTQTARELFATAPEIEVHEGDRIVRDVTFKPLERTGVAP